MKCPRCHVANNVFTFQAEKTDKCGVCSNYALRIVKCQNCGMTWCPPHWQLAINPQPAKPQKPMRGIADDSFDI